jgi:hypothetical protein
MTTTTAQVNYEEQEHIYPKTIDYKAEVVSQEELSSNNSSLLLHFIKNLKIGTDLTQISSPINFDGGYSVLERHSEDMRPSDRILGISQLESSEERFLQVLHYIISPLCTAPSQGFGKPRKPFNPILGEEFNCLWNHSDNSQTFVIAEQVSHHPPISAFYLYNKQNNFVREETIRPFPMFLGNKFEVSFSGHCRIHIFLPDGIRETYEYSSPAFCGKGLFIGKACYELSKELKISCERTGLEATIKFKSGNVVKGEIVTHQSPQQQSKKKNKPVPIYEFDGYIVNQVYVTDLRTKKRSVFCDATNLEHLQKVVKPVSKQKENESRRVWHNVTYGIRTKSLELATNAKLEIEAHQRQLAKQNKDKEHQPLHFTKTDHVQNKVNHYLYNKAITQYEAPVVQEKVEDDLD